MFALISVWIALGVFFTTIVVVVRPSTGVEAVVTLLPYTIAFSATLASAVLWVFRKRAASEPGIAGQRLQAIAALVIDSISFAILLFALQDFRFAVTGLVIEAGFLYVCWWGYTRIVLAEK